MRYAILMVLLIRSSFVQAEVYSLNLELKRMPFQRDYFIPDETSWDHEVSLNMDVRLPFKVSRSLPTYVFLESDVTGQFRNSRARNMWWDYTLGVSVFDWLSLVWDHRSQHTLDEKFHDKYPVRDSYGVRIDFVKAK